jgi:type II secretory pathway pseudopilin PulG
LIESIAVMAVIAILAAMAVPTIIRRVDRAAWVRETADLNAIGDALSQSIVRTKSIPTFTNWASAVASQMSLPVSAVLTNGRRYARAFLVDPMLDINGDLPYTQTINGTSKPNNARVMIVSSLSGPLQNGIRSEPQDMPTFQALWDTPEGGTPAGWTMSGDELRIKKLNLEPLFHQLILYNHDPPNDDPARDGPFSIDRVSNNRVPSGTAWNRYYLESTDLGLLDSNFNLRTRYLLNRSISYIFESGSWRGQIQGGETFNDTNGVAASAFLTLANTFYNKPISQNAAGTGASPSSVLVTMYTFMFDYVFWATQCPRFDRHGYTGNTPSGLPEYNMLDQMGQNSSPGSASIDAYSGNNGLLK